MVEETEHEAKFIQSCQRWDLNPDGGPGAHQSSRTCTPALSVSVVRSDVLMEEPVAPGPLERAG